MQYQYKKIIFTILSIISIIGYGYFVYAAAPNGGYNPGDTLDPDCAPGDTDCIVALAGGGSGWGLTGNSSTDADTNFIGTTDAQDFVIKTNGNEIIRLLTDGSFAANGGVATEGSFAWGKNAVAQSKSFAFSTGNYANALGSESWALGSGVDAYADYSIALGKDVGSYSIGEISLGFNNTEYMPVSADSFNTWYLGDRLFNIGNGGLGSEHNAYTLWKDGSFAYNDDNFQNDNPGTEQNMFYFNYGNHDGLGVAQTKRAIRLGSTINDEWDIDSANVGDRSIAIGFGSTSAIGDGSLSLQNGYAQGSYSFAVGLSKGSNAQGDDSIALGYDAFASGNESIALGNSQATGLGAYSFGYGRAYGDKSLSLGLDGSSIAYSGFETVMGYGSTLYIPVDTNNINGLDRLFFVGNGTGAGFESDALTILKNGQTGIAIDNFEANSNGNIFQVGDGSTGIIGYVDNGTGNWVAVSDERKKDNITDLTYGLNELIQLRPTSFNYKRNNEHTIGFLAQQVLPIIPEAVYGTESEGYGMSYATLTPVIVKAIQEMNLKITDIGNTETPNTWRDALIAWFGNVGNGITDLYVKTFHADRGEFANEICLGQQGNQTCVTKDQLDQLLLNSGTVIAPTNNEIVTDDDSNPVIDPVIDESSDNNQEAPVDNSTSESGSENTEVTE